MPFRATIFDLDGTLLDTLGRFGPPKPVFDWAVLENRELMERLSNRIGYHFHLQRAAWPRRVGRDGFKVELTWTNLGVAPVYIRCAVALALLDESGTRIATTWPAQCRPQAWVPGEPVLEKAHLKFPVE